MRRGSRLQHSQTWQWQICEVGDRDLLDAGLQPQRFCGMLQCIQVVRRGYLLQYEIGGKGNVLQMTHSLKSPDEGLGRK